MKGLVAQMVGEEVSAKMITNVVQVVKGVVASAVNEDGEQLYPRQWNHDFMDLPIVTDQHRPSFTSETVTAIVEKAAGRYRVLYALCAASGMRIGEALGLEIDKHILDAGSNPPSQAKGMERPNPQFSENRERQAGNRPPFFDRPNARSVHR